VYFYGQDMESLEELDIKIAQREAKRRMKEQQRMRKRKRETQCL